jgi:hypothetical protein
MGSEDNFHPLEELPVPGEEARTGVRCRLAVDQGQLAVDARRVEGGEGGEGRDEFGALVRGVVAIFFSEKRDKSKTSRPTTSQVNRSWTQA